MQALWIVLLSFIQKPIADHSVCYTIIMSYWKKVVSYKRPTKIKIKAYEQLVLLGFAITSFTPVAYQRHSL